MVLEFILSLLNPFFLPLVRVNDIFAIAVIALVVTLIVSFAQKKFTNQALMKQVKSDLKNLQKKMKAHRSDPEKMMKINTELLDKQRIYMTQSFKPMLITFLPLLLILTWVGTHLSYFPVEPGVEFTVSAHASSDIVLLNATNVTLLSDAVQPVENGVATWTVVGEAGHHEFYYSVDDETVSQTVIISDVNYARPVKSVKSTYISSVQINNEARHGRINFYFFTAPTMMVLYIVFSIVFSIITRKIMGLN